MFPLPCRFTSPASRCWTQSAPGTVSIRSADAATPEWCIPNTATSASVHSAVPLKNSRPEVTQCYKFYGSNPHLLSTKMVKFFLHLKNFTVITHRCKIRSNFSQDSYSCILILHRRFLFGFSLGTKNCISGWMNNVWNVPVHVLDVFSNN